MHENVTYRNHYGEEITIDGLTIDASTSGLHEYAWTATTKNNRISGFTRGVTTYSLPLIVVAKTDAEGLALRDSISEIAEKDVREATPGTLWVNDYYLPCYITASTKKNLRLSNKIATITLTVTTDQPFWVQEQICEIDAGDTEKVIESGFEYPYEYAYEYTVSTTVTSKITNDAITDSDFKIELTTDSGESIWKPILVIGGNIYGVNVMVRPNETLTIDSKARTIQILQADGNTRNVFRYRNRDGDVFKKIPAGTSKISENSNHSWTVTIYDERSEPEWT